MLKIYTQIFKLGKLMMKKFTALMMGLLIANIGWASNWVLVSGTDDFKFYIDTESIKSQSVNGKFIVAAWTKYIHNKNLSKYLINGQYVRKANFLYLYDCNNQQIASKQRAFYSLKGEVLDSDTTSYYLLEYQNIIPDTVSEAGLNFVCNTAQSKQY